MDILVIFFTIDSTQKVVMEIVEISFNTITFTAIMIIENNVRLEAKP